MAEVKSSKKEKYDKFCYHYASYDNQRQAAIAAGYSEKSAHVAAQRLLKIDYVQQKLKELREEEAIRLREEYAITKENIRKKLAKIAFGNIGQVLDWDEDTMKFIPKETCENEYLIKSISIKSADSPHGRSHSQKIVIEDRVRALEALDKSIGAEDGDNDETFRRNSEDANKRLFGLLGKYKEGKRRK